jgi:S-adenosylmethionine:tRNA ribosyltransferase-isomerase
MITNFHPPESTLLMLSAAFAGHDELMEAYQEAIKKKYKFMAYGDALLII